MHAPSNEPTTERGAERRPASAVEIADLSVSFSTKQTTVHAVKDVSLQVRDREFMSLLGPSGCGKSTLLRVIADLVPASAGTVSVLGADPAVTRRSRSIGFVFQNASLLPWRSALENVRLPLEIGSRRRKQSGGPVEDPAALLKLVGLGDRADAYPEELSGGMRQRVAIARALVTKPRILLMDEPFGALDEINRETLNKELLRIWAETGTTIIFVTHSIPEAVFLSQRIAVLTAQPGRLVGIVDVDLPDERDYDLLDTPEFAAVTHKARTMLHGGR